MAYGQINYQQRLGTGPTVDTIADVGCFLTAFCNLLERFGEAIDPPTLNNFFIQHGTFLADGADHDNLGWGSVSAYDGNIIANQVGGAGWPQTNDAIVKFIYKSSRTGAQVTHFCLVSDWTQRVIIDSWDGQTKVSPYGNPVAWATYEKHTPQVIASPPPAADPAFTIENIAAVTKQLRIDTSLWNLNQRSWPAMANNPVANKAAGFQFQTSQIAHHVLGGTYYMPSDGDGNEGYNTVDCIDPTPVPAPVAAPAAPKVYDSNVVDGITFSTVDGSPKPMYINKPEGAEKWSFQGVTTWRDFKSVQHFDYGTQVFIVGKAVHPVPPTGAVYLMIDPDFGNFRTTGTVINEYGFNQVDLSETKPPALPMPAPAASVVAQSAAPAGFGDWRDTYLPLGKSTHFISTRSQIVTDLTGAQGNLPLAKYVTGTKIGLVTVYGTVTKDGVEYYRLRAETDKDFDFWYCVPKIDPNTHTPNLLVMPGESTTPISKATIAKDTVVLAKSHVEINGLKFLDDILPKFLRNKK